MKTKMMSPPRALLEDQEDDQAPDIPSLLGKMGVPGKPKKNPSRSFDYDDPRLKAEKITVPSSRREIDHSMPVGNLLLHGHVEVLQPLTAEEMAHAKKIVHTRVTDDEEGVCRYVPRARPKTRKGLGDATFVIVRERKGHVDSHYPLTNPEVLPSRSPFVHYVINIALKPLRRTEEIVEKLIAAKRLSEWDGKVILARKLQFAQVTTITSWSWQPLEVQKVVQRLRETALGLYAEEPDKCTVAINPNRTEARADMSSTQRSKAKGKKYLTLDALRHAHFSCARTKEWLTCIVLEGVFLTPVQMAARNVAMATAYGKDRYREGALDEIAEVRLGAESKTILEMPVLWALKAYLLEPSVGAAEASSDSGAAVRGEKCNVKYMVKARHIEDMARRAAVLDINFVWTENKLTTPYWARLPHSDMVLYVAAAAVIHMHGRFHRYMESMVNLTSPETVVKDWRRFWPEQEAMPCSQVKVRCPMNAGMVLETAVASLAKEGYVEGSVDNHHANLVSIKAAHDGFVSALRQFSNTHPSPSLTLIDANRTNRHALEAVMLELAEGNEDEGSIIVALPVGRDAPVLSSKIQGVLMAMSSPRFVMVPCDAVVSKLTMERAKTLVVVDCHRWTYGNLTKILDTAKGKAESLVIMEDWFLSSSDKEHECPQVNHSLEMCKQFWLDEDIRCKNPFCMVEPQPITCNDLFDTLMKNLPVVARGYGFKKVNIGFLHHYSRLDSEASSCSVGDDRRLSTVSTHEYQDIAVALQKATSLSSVSSMQSSAKSSITDSEDGAADLAAKLGSNLGKPMMDEGIHVTTVQLLRLLRVTAISNFDLELNQFVFKLQMWPSVGRSDPLRTGYNCAVSIVKSDQGMVMRAFDAERVIDDCSECSRVHGRSLVVYCHRMYEEKKKFDARVKSDEVFRKGCTHVGAMMWHYELRRYVIITEKLPEDDGEDSYNVAYEQRPTRTHKVANLSASESTETLDGNEPQPLSQAHRSCSDLSVSESRMDTVDPLKLDDPGSPSSGQGPVSLTRLSSGCMTPNGTGSSCVRFITARASDMIPSRYVTMGRDAPPTDMVVIVMDPHGKTSKEVDCRSFDAIAIRANKLLVLTGRDIDIKDTMQHNASTIGTCLFKKLDKNSRRAAGDKKTEVCIMNGQCPGNVVPIASTGDDKNGKKGKKSEPSPPVPPHVHTIMCEPGQPELAKVGRSVQTFIQDQCLSAFPNPRSPTCTSTEGMFTGTPLSSPRNSLSPDDALMITNLIAAGPPKKDLVVTTGCINIPTRRSLRSLDSRDLERATPENEVAVFPDVAVRRNYLDSWKASKGDSELEGIFKARAERRKSMKQHTGAVVYDNGDNNDLNMEIQEALTGVNNIGSRLSKLL